MVAGGWSGTFLAHGVGSNSLSSVLALLPGAITWTPLASLPRALGYAGYASVVGGRLRVTSGYDGRSYRSEVMHSIWKLILAKGGTIN